MNAVIYARYSSHGQTEQSIEGQLRDNYEFAAHEGYNVIGEYIDRAQSGRTDGRTDFQRMIADASKKQFSVIIVWKLDRFARNRYDSAIYKAKLKKLGIRVISAKENISDNPEGIILEGMLESMAEYYSANLSVNVKRGQRETVAKGNFCGGIVPYGYKVVEGKLVADELTAPVIRYVFEQYAAGVPKRKIIDDLTARGVKSPMGKPLGISTFQHALKMTAYIGHFMRGGQEVVGCCEPLIDEETFYKVQERLKTVAHAPAATKADVEYLLRGKAFCGHCGSNIVGDAGTSKTGVVHHYYSCAKRKKSRTCSKKTEKKDFIEWYIVEQTCLYVLTPYNMEKISKAVVAEYNKEFGKSHTAELERAIDRIERECNALVDSIVDAPKSTHKRIYAKLEALEVQKSDMETDLAKLRIAQGISYTEKEVVAWLKQFCNGDPLDMDFRRRIIDVFVNSVYLYDDKVVVFYNIRGGKQVSYIGLADAIEGGKSSDLNALAPSAAGTSAHSGRANTRPRGQAAKA